MSKMADGKLNTLDECLLLSEIISSNKSINWNWHIDSEHVEFDLHWAAFANGLPRALHAVSVDAWRVLTHAGDLDASDRQLKRHIAGDIPIYECEIRMRDRNGKWAWMLARGRVVTSARTGLPAQIFGTHINITRRKQHEEALRKAEALLNRTGSVAGVGSWHLDLRDNSLSWSPQTRIIHGVSGDFQPTLDNAIQFYREDSRPVIEAAVRRAIATGEPWDLELPIVRVDGEARWVRAVGSAEMDGDQVVELMGALQDVTHWRNLNARLAEQHELLEVTLRSICDAVVTTDVNGRIVWLNPAAESMIGLSIDAAKGRLVEEVVCIVNDDTGAPVAVLADARGAGRAGVDPEYGCTLISGAGAEYGIQHTVSPIRHVRGELFGFVLVFRDVSDQRRLHREISYRATHDTLTGLLNRQAFEHRLAQVLDNARSQREQHVLIYIDLDQFKLVNDTCGHAVGDRFLKKIGDLLRTIVDGQATLARIGGDEFAVVMRSDSMERACGIAIRICEQLEDFRFFFEGRRLWASASIGLVPIDSTWPTYTAILQAADMACYAAKDAGRNRVHVWADNDQAMRVRLSEVQWASSIEQALDHNRFVLYLQRIDPIGGQAGGLHAEVLLRMLDADGVLVRPGAFLPAAEKFNLASRIDRWVLSQVVNAMTDELDLSRIACLCVNLSGQSISDREFHHTAIGILRAAGSEVCRRLCVEITETAVVQNLADARAFINQIRALGIRVALDDFGAGASSFSYLKNLPVDTIKIDGQFVRGLMTNQLDELAVRCFVDVAKAMGLKTVAEFVDDEGVLKHIGELGIDYAQGFLLHKPEPMSGMCR